LLVIPTRATAPAVTRRRDLLSITVATLQVANCFYWF
jgi:hypothetical protein